MLFSIGSIWVAWFSMYFFSHVLGGLACLLHHHHDLHEIARWAWLAWCGIPQKAFLLDDLKPILAPRKNWTAFQQVMLHIRPVDTECMVPCSREPDHSLYLVKQNTCVWQPVTISLYNTMRHFRYHIDNVAFTINDLYHYCLLRLQDQMCFINPRHFSQTWKLYFHLHYVGTSISTRGIVWIVLFHIVWRLFCNLLSDSNSRHPSVPPEQLHRRWKTADVSPFQPLHLE